MERTRDLGDGTFGAYAEDGVLVARCGSLAEAEQAVASMDAATKRRDQGRTDGKHSVFRQDFAREECTVRSDGPVQVTPSNGLRVQGRPARTGIYEYEDWTGKVIREFRPDSEVFDPESLASYEDAPLTDGHPADFVDPENWRNVSIGHISGRAKKDGMFVRTDIAVQESLAIRRLATKERGELSPGYTLEIDPTPGETEDGEKYDRIQRRIRINHVALGRNKDWGRGGPEVRVLMDRKDGGDTMKLRVDGIEQEVTESGAQALLDRAAAKVAEIQKAQSEATAKADAAAAALAKADAELKAATDPATIEAAVKARADFLAEVRAVLGSDAAIDGKTEDELRRAVITAQMPDAKLDGLTDLGPHYRAALDLHARAGGTSALEALHRRVAGSPGPRKDADQVRRERIARMNQGKPIAG